MNTFGSPNSLPGITTTVELERYLGIKGDKRRELLAFWGFQSSSTITWAEIWSAMGLEATQPRKLWADLQIPLLDIKEVSQITGTSVDTINVWCRKDKYPKFFPRPFRLGSRSKKWISLEVLAYQHPNLYLARAKGIRRKMAGDDDVKTPSRILNVTLNPLPSAPLLEETSSPFERSANLTVAERTARDAMFQTTEELITEMTRQEAFSVSPELPTMNRVIEMLEEEIQEGHPASSRRRAQCALRSLLCARKLTPDTVELKIQNFDRLFPRSGWNSVNMPTITQKTYLDYRKRARAAVEKALGISQQKKVLRERVDNWTNVSAWLKNQSKFEDPQRELSCIVSTLTMCARENNLRPEDLTESTFLTLYSQAPSAQKKSLRNAARLIERLQADEDTSVGIRCFFPHPIGALRTTSPRKRSIPAHFQSEIDMMVEVSSRIKYLKIRKSWQYLAKKTTESHRKAMRAIVHALMEVDRLEPSANTIKAALSDPDGVEEALKYLLSRVDRGEIKASSAATMVGYLPPILERNGIKLPELREDIKANPEFKLSIGNSQMDQGTQDLCRALIERLEMRADFLLSHAPLRREAEEIMRLAKNERRSLNKKERTRVRQLGTAALFCAIECGGAPIRVNNFLKISINDPDAWLTVRSKNEFDLIIPASETKNKEAIDAFITASTERYHDTVRWFLDVVRPHFFRKDVSETLCEDSKHEKAAKYAAQRCRWLVPGVKNSGEHLGYETFLGWFQNLMRDVVGVACDPHNFRHGQASLLYHEYPERIDMIAKRLGDKVETVVQFYAWVHNEILMREGQKALVSLIPGGRRA